MPKIANLVRKLLYLGGLATLHIPEKRCLCPADHKRLLFSYFINLIILARARLEENKGSTLAITV